MNISTGLIYRFQKRSPAILIFIAVFTALVIYTIASPNQAHAGGQLQILEHRSIAPASIPGNESQGVGTDNVGMTRMKFNSTAIFGSGAGSISQITVQLTGTLDPDDLDDIDQIRVYYEDIGSNTFFDREDVGGDDVDVVVNGPFRFDSGNTKAIDINTTLARYDDAGERILYVAFDFVDGVSITDDVGCEITVVEWIDDWNSNTYTSNPTAHTITENVDDYETTLTATGIAPAQAFQDDTRVGIMKLVFTTLDSDVTSNIDTIRLHRVGTGADSDIATGGVILYDDSGSTPGSFDAGDQEVTAGSLSSGYVTLNPGSDLPVTSTGATYYVAVNIASDAQLFEIIGLEIENPSTDITFNDVDTDPYVSVQYKQKGYISSTAATPVANNTVLIQGGLNVQEHISIAPSSIPKGTADVGMAMMRFTSSELGTQSVSSISVRLTGTTATSDIQEIKVYYEAEGGNGLFDRGGGDDVNAVSGGPYTFDSGITKTINLNPNTVTFSDTGSVRLYVAFDFIAGADTANDAGCEVLDVVWGPDGDGTGNTSSAPGDWSLHGATENVDDYETTLTATGVAPVDATQSEQRVGIFKLEFSALDTSVTANIDAIRFHRVGTGTDSDIATGGVILFDDSGSTPGSFDIGDQEVVAGSLSGGYVLLNPASNLPVTSSGAIYFIAFNVDVAAQIGEMVGLEIEDPSNDITFNDVHNNPYVSTQYTQEGYITSSVPTPSSGNTILILIIADTVAPTITYTDPNANARTVPIDTEIIAVFSENIDPSTVTTATFIVKDTFNNQISGTLSTSANQAIFTPNSDLDYDTIYTAQVIGGDSGIKDLFANPLVVDFVWSFTTREDVPKPVAANNRILPGSTDPVKIYIPEPSGGPNAKVTVQVYTVTGKRVATLVNNRPYTQIKSQIPLLWYGKNGRQQDLGPGLYFIQVLSGNDKTVLKVLIVR